MRLHERAVVSPGAKQMLVALLVTLAQEGARGDAPASGIVAGEALLERLAALSSQSSAGWPTTVRLNSSCATTATASPGACRPRRAGTRSTRCSSTSCDTAHRARCSASSSGSRVPTSTRYARRFVFHPRRAGRSSRTVASARRSSRSGARSPRRLPTPEAATASSTEPSRATRSRRSTPSSASRR